MLILSVFLKKLSVILLKIIVHTQKNINHILLVALLTKLFALIINSVKKLFFTEEKMLFTNLLKPFLVSILILGVGVGGTGLIKKHFNKNLIMSTEEEEKFQLANSCWICEKLFDVGDDKVRDHCHITGRYRGASHWSCNINLKMSKIIPVMFHNLRGYENHLIIKEVSKFDVKLSVITNGLEKYMAFTINRNLVFIDSVQFMNSSLDSLVKNLSDHDFVCLSEEFSGKFLKLVKQKGVYPYKYMDSFEKFFEDKLPNKCEFFSSLKDRCISEKDYLKAINAIKVFKMNTLGDYHDLYLKTDVLKKFIKSCLDYCGLDPCHYFSSPGLSWDAMLKMTGTKLDLISDIDIVRIYHIVNLNR